MIGPSHLLLLFLPGRVINPTTSHNGPKYARVKGPAHPLNGLSSLTVLVNFGEQSRRRDRATSNQRGARNTPDGASGLFLPFLFNAAAPLLGISPRGGRSLSTNCSPRKARRRPYRCR